MKRALVALVLGCVVSGVAAYSVGAQAPGGVTLTRLDCGTVQVNDLDQFSDTRAYVGRSKTLTSSCYLIRHGNEVMLWDTGLPAALKGQPTSKSQPMSATVRVTLAEQLAQLGLRPEQVTRIGVSHYHFDHIGQAASFPGATLMLGAGDWTAISAPSPDKRLQPDALRPWISGGSKVEPIEGDRDIFGDGTVQIINLPGHTPGHHGLLVKLARRGHVLLTGDQAHFTENYQSEGVPGFNWNRADTLASFKRFKDMARNLKATVVIQHEPADIAKLPVFPQAAD